MHISGDVAIRSTLRAGSVLYFAEATFRAHTPHYFVVLNREPLSDPVVVMVNATSNVTRRRTARVRQGMADTTLVNSTHEECPWLDRTSLFDCNSVTTHTVGILITKYGERGLRLIDGAVPQDLLERLRLGVLSSPLVAERIKAVLR